MAWTCGARISLAKRSAESRSISSSSDSAERGWPTWDRRKAPGRHPEGHTKLVIKLDTKNWSKFDDFKSCRANLAGPCGQKEGQVTPAQHRRWACTAAHLQGPKYVYYTCLYSNVQLYIYIFFFKEIHIYIYLQMHKHIHIYTYIHTYMHACMHEYIHTYINTYIHTYLHTYVHTYNIDTYIHYITLHYIALPYVTIHAYIHTCMQACIHTYI